MFAITMSDLRQLAQAVVDELHAGGTCHPRSSGHQGAICKLRRYLEDDPFVAAQVSQDSQTDMDAHAKP